VVFTGHQSDLVNQAEMFTTLARIIRDSGGDDDLTLANVRTYIAKFYGTHSRPRVFVLGHSLHCDHSLIDLAGKPQQMRLFRAFLEAPGHKLSIEQILSKMYGPRIATTKSAQFLSCTKAKTVKLISRCRIAASNLEATDKKPIDWLVFDQRERCWHLYRLRADLETQMMA